MYRKLHESFFFLSFAGVKRIIIILLLILTIVGTLYANGFTSGGITYAFTSANTVSVVAGENPYTETVTIPATVEHNDVTYQVTAIGAKSFLNCQTLLRVNLPEGLKHIGEGAFYGCCALYLMEIPASVESIGEEAFARCTRLYGFYVHEDNQHYQSIDKVLMSKDGRRLIAYPNQLPPSYRVPEGVTEIAPSAFLQCTCLYHVTLPSTLLTIGSAAFYGCLSLQEIQVPANVEHIGLWAFSECEQLATATLSNSVSEIGEGAFSFCPSLQYIRVSNNNSHYTTIDDALLSKDQHTLIACPGGKHGSYRIPSTVETIAPQAFYGCNTLEQVTLTPQVRNLGENPFVFCDNLKAVLVSDDHPDYVSRSGVLLNKEETAIIYYPNAKTGAYTLPASITSVQAGPFMRCSKLSSLTIPQGVETIADWAFLDCENLLHVSLPASLTSLGKQAFDNPSLQTVFTSMTPMSTNAFGVGPRPLTTLYLPKGTEDLFYQYDGWTVFGRYQSFGLYVPDQSLPMGNSRQLMLCTTGDIRLTDMQLDMTLPDMLTLDTRADDSYAVTLADQVSGSLQCSQTATNTYHLTLACDDKRDLQSKCDTLLYLTVSTHGEFSEAVYDLLLENISFNYIHESLSGVATQPTQTSGIHLYEIAGIQELQIRDKMGAVYNLHGQQVRGVGEDTAGLPAGIYIVNGRKILIQ